MTVTPVKVWADDASGSVKYYIDGIEVIGAAGTVTLSQLSDYTRGDIIRGGATVWEDHPALNSGFIVQGDGTDVKSAAFDWDTFSAGAGADMVHDHSSDVEGGTLPVGSVTAHPILGAQHSDTATQAVTRGSLVYGDATPEWNELVIGATSAHLESDGTDVAWQANLTMADEAWIGLGSGAGRLLFDSTPAPDQIEVTAADLYFATTAHGIIHVDGNTAGYVLRADGTRFVPANPSTTMPITPSAQGDILIADATPEWVILTLGATAGYALVSTATTAEWDQTPAWTGLHSFGAGWGLTGGTGDLNGNDLIIDTDGDSYLHASGDDVIDLVLAGATGEFAININTVEDFTFTANSFNILTGSYVTVADQAWVGLGAAAGRLVFDSTAEPDQVEIATADLYFATASRGIIHVDGNTSGWLLMSDGTRYIPTDPGTDLPIAPSAQGDMLLADATPAWTNLNIGAQYTHLESGGTTATWAASLSMADDTYVGVSGGGRLVFDSTPTPDQIEVTAADLYFATTAHGIVHVDGNTSGYVLQADGTRYVPANAATSTPVAPVLQGDMLVADITPAWTVLTLGAQYTRLESTGTTAAWQSNVTLTDGSWVGLGAASGRLVFDATVEPDQIEVTTADLYFATASRGIIHVDGVTSGWLLMSDGTRYVPTDPGTDLPIAPVAQGDLLIADATPAWSILTLGAAAGYALVSTATTAVWDQTPAWTGLHSFAAGVTLNGASGANNVTVPDNAAIAVELLDAGGIEYLRLVTTDAQPIVNFNSAAADVDFHVEASGVADALQVQGSDGQITLGVLGAGIVQATAGGVLSSGTIDVGDISDLAYAVPALTFSTSNAAGSADSVIRSDATLALFDATVPGTIECDDSAAAGSAGVAARRDHQHAIVCAAPGANLSVSTTNSEGSAASFGRSDHGHAITTSSNPGAAAAILATDASGYLQLVGLGIGAAAGAANRITIVDGGTVGQAAGPLLTFDDSNNYLEITGCNVGIGTATPQENLDVSAAQPDVALTWTNAANYGRHMFYENTTNRGSMTMLGSTFATADRRYNMEFWTTSADGDITFHPNGIETVRIEAGGNVGINDASPDAALDIVASDSATATTTDVLILEHTTSGTAAADFGAGMLWKLEEAGAGVDVEAMRLAVVWEEPGANEAAEFQLQLNTRGTLYESGVIVAPGTSDNVAGNQRGVGAVDWQGYRTAVTEVASGDYATIIGGAKNTASGDYSVAMGLNAEATHYGEVCRGWENNYWRREFVVYRTVTHSTSDWYSLYLEGASASITMPTDSVWAFSVRVVGMEAGAANYASYQFAGIASNDGGTSTLDASSELQKYETDATWAAQVTVNDGSDTLEVQVSDSDAGSVGIHWCAVVDVTYVQWDAV